MKPQNRRLTRAIRAVLERNRAVTVAFLVRSVVGALRAPVEQASVELPHMWASWTASWIRSFLMFAVTGIIVVIEWASKRVTRSAPMTNRQTDISNVSTAIAPDRTPPFLNRRYPAEHIVRCHFTVTGKYKYI